jgi:glutamate carboxypeptidase
MKTTPALALLAALVAAPLVAGGLDAVEARIVASIDRHREADLALLRELVEINSGTMNLEGVRRVGARLGEAFEAIGGRSEWRDGAAVGRAGNLVVHFGTQGPKVLLIGHLDTVFAAGDDFQEYTEIDATHAKGPGIIDMKGGDLVILSALRALGEAGVLDRLQLRVVVTGDEEHPGRPLERSKQDLVEAAEWADVALGFEDGDGNPRTAVVSRRGFIGWEVEVEGTPAHSSQIFTESVGDGAIYEAARILDGFRRTLAKIPDLTFNPGVIVGGTRITLDAEASSGTAFGKTNVVAQATRIRGDIRALSPAQEAMTMRMMRQIVARNLPGTKASIHFGEGYPPVAPTEGNRRLLATYDQASRDLGFGPVEAVKPRNAGAADISFTANLVDAALDGLGLMGAGGHTKDETADLSTFTSQAKRAALLLHRLPRP